ncbi:TetR/AcrR family transcriptional regulator [Mycobacterium sp. 663a-19]|uniref:TetR/AcrR family transcriptional regulator n=1 Tax=Mycobacterium sp. 663a-19 TaxID=2986148 RepID=UPI002D1EF823|nr:TetR/AcrR family transcriptional regulator [Mycobacterium sp. 663a-19]MEB3980768.1 TetR/AcrR family transcriptional regulator [Mycobacterium sp. 663a-19]
MSRAARLIAERAEPSQSRVQRRGVERRRAILTAAKTILSEQGYAAATLKAVGDRAGIPIASMYHYFSDRHDVEMELIRAHLGELDKHVSEVLRTKEIRTLGDATDAIIDPLMEYFRTHPDCAELWFAGRNEAVTDLVQAFDDEKSESVWRMLLDRHLVRDDTPLHVIRLAFEAGNRLFDIAFRRSPDGDDATMAEARRMITAYLATYAPTG